MFKLLCVLFAFICVFRPSSGQLGCNDNNGTPVGACRLECDEDEAECPNDSPTQDCENRVCCCPGVTVGCHIDEVRGEIGVCVDDCDVDFNECVNDGTTVCTGELNTCCCPLAPGQ